MATRRGLDDQKIRKALARQVGRSDLDDVVWHKLVQGDRIDSLREGIREEWELAVEWVRDLYEVHEALSRDKSSGGALVGLRQGGCPPRQDALGEMRSEQLLSEYERERSRIYGEYVCRHAAASPRVRLFRQEVFGSPNAVLSPERARGWLRSETPAIVPRELFQKRGIPIVDHHAIRLDSRPLPGFQDYRVVIWRITWANGECILRTACLLPWRERERIECANPLLYFPDEKGLPDAAEVFPDSVFRELQELGSWLDSQYAWDPYHAIWFVLTGVSFWDPPFSVDIKHSAEFDDAECSVILQVKPWVTEQTVTRIFTFVQRLLLGHKNRHPTTRTLALLCFVFTNTKGESRPPWRVLMERWNKENPAWSYANVSSFSDAVRTAEEAVLRPRYGYTLPPPERDWPEILMTGI